MGRKQGTALKKAERFEMAGEGLWYSFLSFAASIAAWLIAFLVLSIENLPVRLFVGGLVLLLRFFSFVFMLYGFYVARDSHIGFHNAFWTAVIGFAAMMVMSMIVIASRVLWAQTVLIILIGLWNLRISCCFLTAVQDLLTQKGDHTWAKGAGWLRWGYGFWFVFSVAVTGISCIPALRESLLLSALSGLRSAFSTALSVCLALICFHGSRSLRT